MIAIGMCAASEVEIVELSYPTHLPYNGTREEIVVRHLPFATRAPHPEFIGSALSAQWVIPNNDSATIPKDINLISTYGITVTTNLISRESKSTWANVELQIDLRKIAKPIGTPIEIKAVIEAIAKVVRDNLAEKQCKVTTLIVEATPDQGAYRQIIETTIPHDKTEPAGAGQPATKPADRSSSEGSTLNPHAEGWPPVAGGRPLALGRKGYDI